MWSQGEINDRQGLCDGRLMKAITPGAMNGGHSVWSFSEKTGMIFPSKRSGVGRVLCFRFAECKGNTHIHQTPYIQQHL